MTLTNQPVQAALIGFLRSNGVAFDLLDHTPCRTSEESAAARAAAGAPDAIGAKALLVRQDATSYSLLLVTPGWKRLDNKVLRPRIGKFRFATPEEIAEVTGGLQPGCIPPFGPPVIPAIAAVLVDDELQQVRRIGFNAATFERSIIMRSDDYFALPHQLQSLYGD